jgi:hypothetical protein
MRIRRTSRNAVVLTALLALASPALAAGAHRSGPAPAIAAWSWIQAWVARLWPAAPEASAPTATRGRDTTPPPVQEVGPCVDPLGGGCPKGATPSAPRP